MTNPQGIQARSWSTDWLNTQPIFFNTKTFKVSHRCLDVIDWQTLSFHPEGLYNYLKYGYCIFGQTQFENIKFLNANETLTLQTHDNGTKAFIITKQEDPCLTALNRPSTVEEVLAKLQTHSRTFEQSASKEKRFLLPLSGGYDSRMLACLIEDKSRIDAFTFGITSPGTPCSEVTSAKEVAKRLNINWEEIPLLQFTNHTYINKDLSLFAPIIPIHAAYHFEFYEKIRQAHDKNYIVLSGTVGDWWGGEKVALGKIESPHDFKNLFFSHSICCPEEFILKKPETPLSQQVFEKEKNHLQNPLYRRIFMGRSRIALASYIFRVAESYFETYTPYYDFDIAMTMLNLPSEKAKNRQWLADFYKEKGLDVSHLNRYTPNDLDLRAIRASMTITDLINVDLAAEFYSPKRVEWINKTLLEIKARHSFKWLSTRKRIQFYRAFNEWTVLKPIEALLRIRESMTLIR